MACRWHENERAVTVADDLPSVVVQLHVVKPAEQYAAVDVGSAVLCGDVVDVVCKLERNNHRGEVSLQATVVALARAGQPVQTLAPAPTADT